MSSNTIGGPQSRPASLPEFQASTVALRGKRTDAAPVEGAKVKAELGTTRIQNGAAVQDAAETTRAARVAELQRAVASGTYQVPASTTAETLIKSLLPGGSR